MSVCSENKRFYRLEKTADAANNRYDKIQDWDDDKYHPFTSLLNGTHGFDKAGEKVSYFWYPFKKPKWKKLFRNPIHRQFYREDLIRKLKENI